jgi:hypothetical protein
LPALNELREALDDLVDERDIGFACELEQRAGPGR